MVFQCIQNKIQIVYMTILDLVPCLTLSPYLTLPSFPPITITLFIQQTKYLSALETLHLLFLFGMFSPFLSLPQALCMNGSFSLSTSQLNYYFLNKVQASSEKNPLWNQSVIQSSEIFSLHQVFLLVYSFCFLLSYCFIVI